MMNFSLRPKFIRSRSSGISDTSTGSTHPIPPAASVLSSSSQRRATIEDFADTESEESNDSNEDIEDKNQDQTNANKQQEHHHHHQQQQLHDIDEDSINHYFKNIIIEILNLIIKILRINLFSEKNLMIQTL